MDVDETSPAWGRIATRWRRITAPVRRLAPARRRADANAKRGVES
jgi:hypothetical protein